MLRFFQKTKGSVSIFLAIIMLPMMVVSGLVVDGSRISAARSAISGAGDLAMNAALSEYDQILYDVYGLFAISENMEELEKNCERYFRNSLENSGLLEDSDSYTREFINSIFGSFSGSDLDFSNIVDVDVDTFSLTGVAGSAIANPSVLERQIVDYMKYRAPINLGKGLLTKIKCIGETSKQTKAIEAKVSYDQKLDTVQQACEDAYKEIKEYNKLVSGDGTKFGEGYIGRLKNDISSAKTNMKTMVKYVLACKDESLKVSSFYNHSPGIKDMAKILISKSGLSAFRLDANVKKEVEKQYKSMKENGEILDYLEAVMSGAVKLKPLSKGTYDYEATDFIKAIVKFNGNYKTTLEDQIGDIRLYQAVPDMKKVFTYTMMYVYYFEEMPEEQQPTYKAKYDAYSELAQIMLGISEFCSEYSQEWKNNANSYGKTSADLLYSWYSVLKDINDTLDRAVEALKTIIKKVNELDKARTGWSKEIDNLSENDIKVSMKGEFENSAQDINEDAINDLIAVLTAKKTYFNSIISQLDAIKLDGVKVCFKADDSTDFTSRYSKLPYNRQDPIAEAAQAMQAKYKDADLTGISPANDLVIGETQQFYRYLVKTCVAVQAEENAENKKNATTLKNDLIKSGNEGASSEAAKLSDSVPMNISDAISKDVMTAINELCADSSDPEEFNATKVEGEKDSDIAEKNKNNLSAISKLLGSLANIAENARDDLYVEEYVTEMFSCYTDTIPSPKDGKTEAKALNSEDMTQNKFFGAETEYILWGKNDVQGNLNSTKAMIFGIRFALNSIYAFTSSDTRTPALTAATAIAGWTGFGVPIVQSVILLAWSMAESAYDVDYLCQGKAVALYKTKDTWVLGIGGLKAVAKKAVIEAVGEGIDDVFAKIENAAIDESGKLIDSVEGNINQCANRTLDGIVESVQDTIAVPMQQLAVQIAGTSEALTESAITEKVRNTLQSLGRTSEQGGGFVNECINMAVKSLLGSDVDEISRKFVEIYETAQNPEKTTNAINEILYGKSQKDEEGREIISGGLIGGLKEKISKCIEGKVDEYGSKFSNKMEDIIREGGDNVKEQLKSGIDEFLGGISGDAGTNTMSVSSATGLSMTYKEYLKVFVLISLFTKHKEDTLKRTVQLIQANVSQQSTGFNAANAFSVVRVHAEADVRTTFFSVPVATVDEEGNTTYDLDYGSIGSGKQRLKYNSVLGY